MMILCPKCRRLVNPIKHHYHNALGQLIRTEKVCSMCHMTLEVYHYELRGKSILYRRKPW